jgi:hypothetical protein
MEDRRTDDEPLCTYGAQKTQAARLRGDDERDAVLGEYTGDRLRCACDPAASRALRSGRRDHDEIRRLVVIP